MVKLCCQVGIANILNTKLHYMIMYFSSITGEASNDDPLAGVAAPGSLSLGSRSQENDIVADFCQSEHSYIYSYLTLCVKPCCSVLKLSSIGAHLSK